MMQNARPFLGPAVALSIALHALALTLGLQPLTLRPPKPPPSELKVHLSEQPKPAAPEAPAPRLTLPEPQQNAIATPPIAAAKPPAAKPSARLAPPDDTQPGKPEPAIQRLSGEAARKAAEQLARELPYPAEAIERGWQGEALVMIFLDSAGNAIAARLEASSGHAILDDAAVRAARQLRALPDSAPREALLPVRFRLR
jgi:periplasmic protein TonB